MSIKSRLLFHWCANLVAVHEQTLSKISEIFSKRQISSWFILMIVTLKQNYIFNVCIIQRWSATTVRLWTTALINLTSFSPVPYRDVVEMAIMFRSGDLSVLGNFKNWSPKLWVQDPILTNFVFTRFPIIGVKIDSFFSTIAPKIIKIPKHKETEINDIKNQIKSMLSSDRTLNVAALVNLLKELLKW